MSGVEHEAATKTVPRTSVQTHHCRTSCHDGIMCSTRGRQRGPNLETELLIWVKQPYGAGRERLEHEAVPRTGQVGQPSTWVEQ